MGKDGYYDVFIMNPDGSGEITLTHNRPGCPQKHNGNPAWHPSGKYIVFTAMNDDAGGQLAKKMGIPGTGINCNLWLMKSDGSKFWKLTNFPTGYKNAKGVIHPQFSPDGKKLFWTERIGNNKNTNWGEWALKTADFSLESGEPVLRNTRKYQPGSNRSFYESHGFSPDGRKVIFSGNLVKGQKESGLDIYEMDLQTGKIMRLTKSLNDWDEHAHYSPDGKKIAWMSGMGFNTVFHSIKGHAWKKYIKTDLWIMDSDGKNQERITFFNQPGHSHYMGGRTVVSDSAWSPDSKKIAALVAYVKNSGQHGAKIVLIELK